MNSKMKQIALVYEWPSRKSCELDMIRRIYNICQASSIDVLVVSPAGEILNKDGAHTGKMANLKDVDFSLHFHYSSPSMLDTFSYITNWNPVDFLLCHPITYDPVSNIDLSYYVNCLRSHDVLLSAGSREVDDFANALNGIRKYNIETKGGFLHPTISSYETLDFPDLRNFKVFYISANWERQLDTDRHGSLIELLDKTGRCSFYGIRESNGVFLWDGVENYCGELPFDGGDSIVKEANKCGVSLVLHSPAHHDAKVTSTRIFQAAAAKTTIISDDNPWVIENFGESVLTYHHDYKDHNKNKTKIMELIHWIDTHPGEALMKAKEANRIFEEKFSLEQEVRQLISNHERLLQKSKASYVVSIFYSYHPETINLFIRDMANQEGVQLDLHIFTPQGVDEQRVEEQLLAGGDDSQFIHIHPMPFNGHNEKEGECLLRFIKAKHANTISFMFYSGEVLWHKNHVLRLAATLHAAPDSVFQSIVIPSSKMEKGVGLKDFVEFGKQSIDKNELSIDIFAGQIANGSCVADSFMFPVGLIHEDMASFEGLRMIQTNSYISLLCILCLNKNSTPIRLPFFTLTQRNPEFKYDPVGISLNLALFYERANFFSSQFSVVDTQASAVPTSRTRKIIRQSIGRFSKIINLLDGLLSKIGL